MYTTLETLRDAFKAINGVRTSKIGIEEGISPSDYPLVRLVPSRFTPGQPYRNRTAEMQVYFGWDISESQGLELVYQKLLGLEEDIIAVIKTEGGRYIETLTDEDRLPTYKLMFIRFEIKVERPDES